MSLTLEGTLADVGLCDLLRLIAREKRSGTLRVTIDGSGWSFALDHGEFVGVRCDEGPENPAIEPTLLALVRHRRGAFRLDPPSADDPAGEGEVPMAGIQAEVLAGSGEMALVRLGTRIHAMGGEDSHPDRGAFPTKEQMEELDAETRGVLALVNGTRSLEEVIVRSGLDPDRALDALDRLAEESLVELEGQEAPRPVRVAPAVGRVVGASRDWVATALPLLLLGLWLAVSGSGSGPVAADPFEIRHDPLAAARAAHEIERLRAAVEAHRFAEGRWPEKLHTLFQGGYIPKAALTDAQGRPYYYARRGDGFVLLAPER